MSLNVATAMEHDKKSVHSPTNINVGFGNFGTTVEEDLEKMM